MNERFTKEQLILAKNVDLTMVAASLGYTVKRVGNYHTLKEMDSIRIYNRTNWYRWSRQYDRGENGGSQIDFLCIFGWMNVKEAVLWLCEFAGHKGLDSEKETKPMIPCENQNIGNQKAAFILPKQAKNNDKLYAYLHKERAISKEVIDYFIHKELIYESHPYHNIVFKGNDKEGNPRFASMRGIHDRNGKGFKCDVAGSDKRYGFHVSCKKSDEIIVLESAIDAMSYMEIFQAFDTNLLALGMLSDAPLATFLREHPNIKKIRFCLDHDQPGEAAAKKLVLKYQNLSYEVLENPLPKPYKDFNQWLQSTKQNLKQNPIKCTEKVY